jgi:hypothetical protein
MMEELSSSETWVLTRITRRNIPEGAILDSVFILSTDVNRKAYVTAKTLHTNFCERDPPPDSLEAFRPSGL